MRFSLSKWYLDCITDQGEVFIGYTALLRLGRLDVHYTSTLIHDGRLRSRTSLRRWSPPALEKDEAVWRSRPLGVEGNWRRLEPALSATLLDTPAGSVVWTCHLPRARATLTVGGRRLIGLGYVEHLELTVPPWRLPIRELRWGRALSEAHSLVWIDWRAPTPEHTSTHAWLDGARLAGPRIGDEGVGDGARELARFSDLLTLRGGAIGTTALSRVAGLLAPLVPSKALQLDEHKWRARAELPGDRGWTIHEVVRWP